MRCKNFIAQKMISKILLCLICLNNVSTYSLANTSQTQYEQYTHDDAWLTGLTPMPTPRTSFTSSVVDGKIYCIGGITSSSSFINKVEVYDPVTNTWETKAPMPTARRYLSSAVLNGKIYCIGGAGNNGYLTTVEIYDPKTNKWSTGKSMPVRRTLFSAVTANNKIYCVGGWNGEAGGETRLNDVVMYDPVTDEWETKTPMSVRRSDSIVEVVGDKIYCISGFDGEWCTPAVEVYNTLNDTWERKADGPILRDGVATAVVNGKIYCLSGLEDDYRVSDKVEVYDPNADTWETVSKVPTPKYSIEGEAVDGIIYCIGGVLNYDDTISSGLVEAYIPLVDIAKEAVTKAEEFKNINDISNARDLVHQLDESLLKDQLQERLDSIFPNITAIEIKESSANADIYIRMKNKLSLSLDTNVVTFNEFHAVEDMIKENAINLTVESSLPYQVNASLESEIQNADGSNILDKSILGIKANTSNDYHIFTDIKTPLILLDTQKAGEINTHGIDLKLNKGVGYKTDIYKTTIKFEIAQR